MRYIPWMVAGLLACGGGVGAMHFQPAEKPQASDAVGFSSSAAQAAESEFGAVQSKLDEARDNAVNAALATYRDALSTAKGQALNEKNLVAANQIVAALKAIDTPDEEVVVDGAVGPPECPEAFLGRIEQFEERGKPIHVMELQKDYVLKKLPNEYGVWFVQNNELILTWSNGAVDRYPIPEEPGADLIGQNSDGFRFRLKRSAK